MQIDGVGVRPPPELVVQPTIAARANICVVSGPEILTQLRRCPFPE